jgi:hypothetical protein
MAMAEHRFLLTQRMNKPHYRGVWGFSFTERLVPG